MIHDVNKKMGATLKYQDSYPFFLTDPNAISRIHTVAKSMGSFRRFQQLSIVVIMR